MKLKSKVIKVSLIFGVLGILVIASMFWRGGSPIVKGLSSVGIFLARPAFAQEDGVSFLEQEAGIAAYTDLGQTVNLTTAKAAFRTLEKETDTYVIGSIPVPGYEGEGEEDLHCFIHKDGWVVAYYLRDEPTSKIMYWKNWDGKTISTKVEEGLMSAGGIVGVTPTNVKYYHFKYPDADKLVIIADKDSFGLTIPGELIVHERSYSTVPGYRSNPLFIDGQSVGAGTGLITFSQLKPDVPHTIKFAQKYGGIVVLVYQGL